MLGYHQYFSRRWPFPLSPTAAPRALWRLGADPHWRALYPCPGRSTSDCEHARRRTAAKGLAIAPRRSGDERGRESVAVRFATAEETARSPARVNDCPVMAAHPVPLQDINPAAARPRRENTPPGR